MRFNVFEFFAGTHLSIYPAGNAKRASRHLNFFQYRLAGQLENLIEYLIPTKYVASLESDSEIHIDALRVAGCCRSAC
jgi:hypothetical protein